MIHSQRQQGSQAPMLDQAEAAKAFQGFCRQRQSQLANPGLLHRIHRPWHYVHAELGFARIDDRSLFGTGPGPSDKESDNDPSRRQTQRDMLRQRDRADLQ
jgi:hypothetical protein